MKLLITVEGRQYEVEVQVLDEERKERKDQPPAGGQAAPAPPLEHLPQETPEETLPAAARPAPDAHASSGPARPTDVKSPAAGNVVSLNVKPGDQVQVNDPLLVIEAMKMESSIVSPMGGVIREVLIKPGDTVAADQVLIRF